LPGAGVLGRLAGIVSYRVNAAMQPLSIESCYDQLRRESESTMREMLSGDLLRALIAVEGRYIQWEFEPQTLQNDYITVREANGEPVAQCDKSGRAFGLRATRDAVQSLIREHSIHEDVSKRAPGFRIYRPTDEGWSRCDLRKAS
jgi:hypothetical protein